MTPRCPRQKAIPGSKRWSSCPRLLGAAQRVGRYDYSARGDLGREVSGMRAPSAATALSTSAVASLKAALAAGDATIGGTPVGEGTRCGSSRLRRAIHSAEARSRAAASAASWAARAFSSASASRAAEPRRCLAQATLAASASLALDVLALLRPPPPRFPPRAAVDFGLGTCRADGGVCRGELVLTGPQHLGGMVCAAVAMAARAESLRSRRPSVTR